MDNQFLTNIQQKVALWREDNYKGVYKETLNILNYIKKVGFLHKPQLEALETYIYIKEVLDNKPISDVFRQIFDNEKDLIRSLGVSEKEIVDLAFDKEKEKKIQKILADKFGEFDYSNQVYALTMGAGKTILMSVMCLYDFVLSYYHQKDERFAKNALVFAPDKTIIESLKEIKTFDYSRVLPKEYQNILLNVKYHYLENVDTPLTPIGNYNIIISNSQKIILKTRRKIDNSQSLFGDSKDLEKKEIENKRLMAIRELKDLMIFVDEAHHSYGRTLEGSLKKTKQTIDYIHNNTKLRGVVNLTGTPYVNNKMIDDVVYHYGLKQGIEDGILKQVRFLEYGNIKSEQFIEEVIERFWTNYKEDRLEGKLPKIAFYASNIEELQKELRPKLEKVLTAKKINLDKVLEYHTEAEDNREEFLSLDSSESQKQFVLLVGKGKEGWNCRSLVSCALYRKPKSSIFVLQSSTRCLRSIGDNSTKATIFLSNENFKILDKELKNNFATDIKEISSQEQDNIEHQLKIEKRKRIKVKKELKEILAVKNNKLDKIKIDWSKYKPNKYVSYMSEGGIFLDTEKEAKYKQADIKKELKQKAEYTYYEIVELVNRYTHLSCLDIEKILENTGIRKDKLVKKINNDKFLLPFIINSIIDKAYEYKEKKEIIDEEIELTKNYPFKISVEQGKNRLVVYKEKLEKDYGKNRIGFHINPYNFDSSDEKDLFKYLREFLDKDEHIVDVYFTGGTTNDMHNDFYFEYYNPEEEKVSKYFPDFLIETNNNRYLIIEVKSSSEKLTYERNKKQYKGNIKDLFDITFAKQIGFSDFQKVNKNFEYRVVFDATMIKEQENVLAKAKSMEK